MPCSPEWETPGRLDRLSKEATMSRCASFVPLSPLYFTMSSLPDKSLLAVRSELINSFGEYHSPIRLQVTLVDRLALIAALEERERCAALAERLAKVQPPGAPREAALAIAVALRAQLQPTTPSDSLTDASGNEQ